MTIKYFFFFFPAVKPLGQNNSNFLEVRKRSDSSTLSDGGLYETALAAFFAAYVDNRHLHPRCYTVHNNNLSNTFMLTLTPF